MNSSVGMNLPTDYDLLFFGGYDPHYPRNAIIRKGWVKCGFTVSECRVDPRWKVHTRYPALLWRYLRLGRPGGLVFVPDFRHKDVPLAWALARFSGRKMVFDPLVSRYETRVLDRGDIAEGSIQSWHNRNIDRISFMLPDLVLSDTNAHQRFYIDKFGVAAGKIRTLYIGFDGDTFKENPPPKGSEELRVLFYGTYLPLHGVSTIVEAASILRDLPVRFTLVGKGQTYGEIRRMADAICPGKIEFRTSVPSEELQALISQTDIVLGIFGLTQKAGMVIPNKVYQALAVGRPVITANTPAIRELFRNGEHILTVPPGDAAALARGIEALRANPSLRMSIASAGGAFVRRGYNSKRVAERLAEILKEAGIL